MATPKKPYKSRSVKKVSSLAQFEKWVDEIRKESMLFRGMANANWKVESSLYRRLKINGLKRVDSDMFLEMAKVLINRARRSQHGMKKYRKSNDLELLVDLQHYGAATCMIDFTKNPFVALFFACGTTYNRKNKEIDGTVVAFNSDNTDSYDKISIKNSDEKIEYWIQNNKLWVLPAKKLNDRAASQESVFVFGSPTLSAQNFRACKITNKEEILEELKEKESISAETLFNDFVGFSALHSHNKKYENWDTDSDFVSGRICHARRDFESAIQYFDKAIKSDSKHYKAYNTRGNAKSKLDNVQDAICDYDEAIILNPKFSKAYNNRGLAKYKLDKFQDAINDYDKTIELSPKYYGTYRNRGLAKYKLDKFQDAISDYDKAIELSPKYYRTYRNRGLAKYKLDKFQDAISDYDKAIELNPKYPTAYKDRGVAKNELGDKKGAVADFAKAKKLNPELKISYLPPDNPDK